MLTISDSKQEDCVILPEHKISKSSCKLSNGEAFFEYDNDQTLMVKVNLFFEDFSCKFETAFSCTKIPEFQASLIKKPAALFKQIMDKKLFPKDFTIFFEPQEKKKIDQTSSKLTEVKRKNSGGKDYNKKAFASGSDDGGRFSIVPFRSPRKGRSINEEISSQEETQSNPIENNQTRQRAKSHTIRLEERKTRSTPEIEIKKTASLKEPLQSKTLRISPREKNERSEKIEKTRNLSPKAHRTSPREILQNLTGKSKHHPPHDASQGSSLDSSPRLYVELEESKSDGSIIVDESGPFKIPNINDGEGWFTLCKDGTLNMKLRVIFEECLWEIERNYSLLEQTRINFEASQIKNPQALFEKVIEKRHLVSENFNPFFCPQRKIVEAVDDLLPRTEKDIRAEVANSSDSREIMNRPVSKSVGHLGNPKVQEANIEMISKYRSLIQSARDNSDRLSDIYFGSHIGRVPPLPKQLYDDLALPWKGQTVAETHSFYLVFEKMNGQRTCFGIFLEAVQRPAKGKEIYRMDLSSSKYPETEFTDLAETPYWILITNEPIEGTEELDEIRKGEGKHSIPNVVEMGIHKASECINHKPFSNLDVSAVCADTKNLNGKKVNMVMTHGSKKGELIVTEASESKGNEVYYGVIRYLPEKKI